LSIMPVPTAHVTPFQFAATPFHDTVVEETDNKQEKEQETEGQEDEKQEDEKQEDEKQEDEVQLAKRQRTEEEEEEKEMKVPPARATVSETARVANQKATKRMARSELAFQAQNAEVMANMRNFYGISQATRSQFTNFVMMQQLSTGVYVLPKSHKIMSLRLIDWFVTNYSKKSFVVHTYTDSRGIKQRFKVYEQYKLQLKSYSKKRFDPFCRFYRISVPYGENQTISTTLGQLQFFKWVIEHKLTDYIDDHVEDIVADMNAHSTASRRNQQNPRDKTRKKREELSVSATKSMKLEEVQVDVSFR